MTTLRKAAEEYLAMRRGFGFKLKELGVLLLDFVSFMEKRHASRISIDLALRWAKLPANAPPSRWATRLSAVRLFALHRSATAPAVCGLAMDVPLNEAYPPLRTADRTLSPGALRFGFTRGPAKGLGPRLEK